MHALVGENGAGKSTLMKILYGMQKPDEGTITVDGDQVTFNSPADAIARGIGMVHQHFMLADNLTVLENVVLGAEKLYGIGQAARNKIGGISEAYGLGVRPDAYVEDLGVADRQRVEILKVLYRGARILILDEPTASSSRRRSTPSSTTCVNSRQRASPSSSSRTSSVRCCPSPTTSPSYDAVRPWARPTPPAPPPSSSPS